MRPTIDSTLIRTNPLVVGLRITPNKLYELNTSRADGLAFHVLPPTSDHHLNLVLTAAARIFALPVSTQTDAEDLIDRSLSALRLTTLLSPVVLTETVATETVKKSNTLLLNERERDGVVTDLVLTTQVTRRISMRHPTTFGCPPGYMTLAYEVVHKDDPHHQFVHSLDAARAQLLKLFTSMQDDYYR